MESVTSTESNIPALLLATVLSFLSVHSSIIEKPLFKWFNKRTDKEKELLLQKTMLKTEQLSLNMVDQFAKYSKLQRRIILIDEELKQISSNKTTNSFLVQAAFSYGVKSVLIFMLLLLSLYYRYTPVFYLSDKIELVPFTTLICYPNATNYVSFYFWVMCSATVARLIK